MSVERVAISQRTTNNESYHEPRDALAHDWSDWVQSSLPGAVLFAAPNSPEQIETWWDICRPDFLVLSGGNDWGDSPVRDQTESILFDKAQKIGVPVLGVCRGLQAINVMLGGGQPEDIGDKTELEHVASTHDVTINDNIAESLELQARQSVNSYHNQGLRADKASDQVVIFAKSEDGIVEGIYHPSAQILAVQWHPERKNSPAVLDKLLLDALIEGKIFWNRKI
jgi:N5-(cytidine 5'-diphosphoramidyl)-L-glutamine hydrolase